MDLSLTIEAKSDQLNADDLIGQDKVITITNVERGPSSEQPVAVLYGNDRPWLPCKSMRRVLVAAWGSDASQYSGRSIKLYCDANVTWGGQKVGGIRIRALSHINQKLVVPLAIKRGRKEGYVVEPLKTPKPTPTVEEKAREAVKYGTLAYQEFFTSLSNEERKQLLPIHNELKAIAEKSHM